LDATQTITNTTFFYGSMIVGVNGTTWYYNGGSIQTYMYFNVHAKYVGTGPVMWITYGLNRNSSLLGNSIVDGPYTVTLPPGGDFVDTLLWNETLPENMTYYYSLSLIVSPVGAAGGYTLYATNPVNLQMPSGGVMVTPRLILGDLGTASNISPFYTFGNFTPGSASNKVTSADTTMYIKCLRGTAPAEFAFLGDLGGVRPTSPFYEMTYYDGKVTSADTSIYIKCLHDFPGIVHIGTYP